VPRAAHPLRCACAQTPGSRVRSLLQRRR
jgi:hypothetical protein